MRFALSVCVSAVLVGLSPAHQDDVEKMLDKKVDVNFTDTTADAAIAHLRDASGLNIIVDRRAADRMKPVTIKLKDGSVRSALRWIATLSGVDVTVSNGVVVFVHPDHPGTALSTRLFDIGGLTSRPADFPAPAPAVEPSKAPVVVLEGNDVRGTPEDSTVDLIRRAIAPSSWDGDDVSIQTVQTGRISVRHYPAVLDQIETFLGALRKLAPTMVTVEAEIFELDADALKKLDGLFGMAIDEAAAKSLLEALQPLRRAKGAESLRLTCSEGQLSHVLVGGQRAINVFTGNRSESSTFSSSTVLELRPALAGKSVKLDLAVRSTRLAEPLATTKIGGWDVDLPESLHVSLRTTLVVPDKGLAVVLLPRASRDSKLPRVMLVRAVASSDAHNGVDLGREAADPLAGKGAIDCLFKDEPASKAVDALAGLVGVNLVLHPDLRDQRLSLALKGVKAKAAVELVAGMIGAKTAAMNDAVFLAPPAAITVNSGTLWIANVRDLSLGAGEPVRDETWEKAVAYDPFAMSDLVRQSVQPRTWGDHGTFCEATPNGLLVMRHSADGIRDVKVFLDALRKRSASVAALRAEIVTVKSDALDGMDAGYLVDAAAAAKLTGGATAPVERLQIEAAAGRRSGLAWTRRRTIVSGEGEVTAVEGKNLLDLLPTDGRLTISVETQEAGDGAMRAVLRTSIAIPSGKAAVFKLGSGDGVTRLLIVRMEMR